MARDVFQRKEIKYLMNEEQYQELRLRLDEIAAVDHYGLTQIMNVYYDTPDFKLITRAMEHPEYKEKLRLRSYGIPDAMTPSFIEIKKKFDGITYKRRIELLYSEAQDYLNHGILPREYSPEFLHNPDALSHTYTGALSVSHVPTAEEIQIQKEIDYFLVFYKKLRPMMAIAYDRIALAGRDDPELRITFDTDLRWSVDELDLRGGNHGHRILAPDQHLMEIKISGAMDLRISRMLSELGIFRTSISKYGRGFEAYAQQRARENRNIYVFYSNRPRAVYSA